MTPDPVLSQIEALIETIRTQRDDALVRAREAEEEAETCGVAMTQLSVTLETLRARGAPPDPADIHEFLVYQVRQNPGQTSTYFADRFGHLTHPGKSDPARAIGGTLGFLASQKKVRQEDSRWYPME